MRGGREAVKKIDVKKKGEAKYNPGIFLSGGIFPSQAQLFWLCHGIPWDGQLCSIDQFTFLS